MSPQRRKRIDVLANWWTAEIPDFLSRRIPTGPLLYVDAGGRVRDYDGGAFRLMHRLIGKEAKRRWAVSESTARDYADVVFGSTERALAAEAEKRGLTRHHTRTSRPILHAPGGTDRGHTIMVPDYDLT